MDIHSLNKSITQMEEDELYQFIRTLRDERRRFKVKKKKAKRISKGHSPRQQKQMTFDDIAKMPKDKQLQLLNTLKERMKNG